MDYRANIRKKAEVMLSTGNQGNADTWRMRARQMATLLLEVADENEELETYIKKALEFPREGSNADVVENIVIYLENALN